MIFLRALGLLVATGCCAFGAAALQRPLPLPSRGARVLCFLLLFTALQSLLILAAGLAGLLSFWPLLLVSMAGGTIALLQRPRFDLGLRAPDRREGIFLIFALAALLSLIVKAFVLSPYTGDALMYHLPKVAEWVQAGRFVWGTNHDPRVWFSAGFELIETWWVVFLHHDVLIEMAGIQMALIALAAVYTLAEAFGASPGFAALAYFLTPAVLLNATSCGNDLAIAALTLAAYALVASGAPRPLQAFPLLLAIGVKATGGFAALGVVIFAAFQNRPSRLSRPAAAALIGSGLLLAGFWYARNWLVAGHPLYPFHGIHGEFTWSPQQGGVDLSSLQSTIQVLDLRLVDPQPFESLNHNNAGWGWAMLPLALPALLLELRRDRRLRVLALSFTIAACVTLACVSFEAHTLRFVLWFPALLAIALARQPKSPWIVAALLACVVNVAATLAPTERRHSEHIRPPAALSPTEPVAVVFDQVAPSYRLYNADYSRRVFYPRSMEELRRSGAKVVYLYGTSSWGESIRRWPAVAKDYYEVR